MVKTSISSVLRARKRIRILTVLATFVVAVALIQMVVAENPTITKAATCTINAASTKDANSHYYIPDTCKAADDVKITGGITVYADSIKVFQTGSSAGTSCNNPSDLNCDSRRHFKSLTIDNAVLTHTAVAVSDMGQDTNGNNSLADEATGTARWKKVDIQTTGDIQISNGAKVNVDGKGYPGGQITWSTGSCGEDGENYVANWSGPKPSCPGIPTPAYTGGKVVGYTSNHGYGLGRGAKGYSAETGINNRSEGGGGGYGGNGGGSAGTYGLAYDTPIISSFDFGSGGGSSASFNIVAFSVADWSWAFGAPGGGRVRLIANTGNISIDSTSSITALGLEGMQFNGSNGSRSYSGAGSGGTISLSYTQNFSTAAGTIASSNGGPGDVGGDVVGNGAGSGADTVPQFKLVNVTSLGLYNLQTDGGVGGHDYKDGYLWQGYGGGGGRILIQKNNTNISIKKTLAAVARNGGSDTTFNPYALRIGDEIKVSLTIANLIIGQSITLSDYSLALPGSTAVQCVPLVGSSLPLSPTPAMTQGQVQWSLTPTTSSVDLSYHCIVHGP